MTSKLTRMERETHLYLNDEENIWYADSYIPATSITRNCKGVKTKTCHGFVWKYASEDFSDKEDVRLTGGDYS